MILTELSLADGFAALNRGDLATAGEACKQTLAANQKHVPAHFLVGLVALEGKQRQVAHEAFKSVVKLDRDHAAAWAHLANSMWVKAESRRLSRHCVKSAEFSPAIPW